MYIMTDAARTKAKYSSNYNKWDHIDVSDDEDDTHPNVDTPSLFRWRHKARIEREEELKKERFQVDTDGDKLKRQLHKAKTETNKEKIQSQLSEWQKREEEIADKERKQAWNVDSLSKDKESRTILNPIKKTVDLSKLSDEERGNLYKEFLDKYKDQVKQYGFFTKPHDSEEFLKKNPVLVCDHTASFLCIYSIDLAQEKKFKLMEVVAHQAISMQFILELAKGLNRHPGECFPAFYKRYNERDNSQASVEYHRAFDDELNAFRERVTKRALERDDEALQAAIAEEEAERQGRMNLSPSGMDPQEVFEDLPEEMKECFASKDVQNLLDLVQNNPEKYMKSMQNCVLAGLWVPAEDSPLYPLLEHAKELKSEYEREERDKIAEQEKLEEIEKEKQLEIERKNARALDDALEELD